MQGECLREREAFAYDYNDMNILLSFIANLNVKNSENVHK